MRIACEGCDNFIGYWVCLAFLKGIPEDIKNGKVFHDKPYEGDMGIRYTKTRPFKQPKFPKKLEEQPVE